MPDIFIGRQPIFNENLDIYAYELLFRGQSDQNDAKFIDGDAATSQVILNTFADIGLSNLVDDHLAFINLTRYFLEEPQRIVIPPGQVVLEILEDIEPDPAILSSIEALKNQGYTIALDDYIHNDKLQPLVDLADIIKIDITVLDMQEIRQHALQFREQGIRLLAEKVETYEEFDALQEIGFDYFQGYFFSRPTVVRGKGLQGNQVSILRLLAMVNNPGLDVSELSKIISTDVSLSHKILKFINSPISGLRAKVDSIQRAVVMLGLNTIKNWISLVALASASEKPEALSILALARARTCEQLAAAAGLSALDSFFTAGLFSALDAMMDQPIDELLEELPLDEELKSALSQREGVYGEALNCVIAMESNQLSKIKFQNIEFARLSEIYLKALLWADHQAAAITA
ncbi:MAG: HDOD domain-containing protein [Gammaproteobacteria bacterium]|nr:HDOD domain-containing protein [Gammaproteobacteria bacterium]